MIKDQIEARGITNKALLKAMRRVKRHLFVPEAYIDIAYSDGPLPIGYGQTISQPYIVAYMTLRIDPKPGQKVLEIGTGSGYQAAILSLLVGSVYTIEIIPELSTTAAERLKSLGYNNIHLKSGDGYFGWKEEAPFDSIVVTAAVDKIPPPLLDQLKDGGKMIVPIGTPFMVQSLSLIQKQAGEVITEDLLPVRFVPFIRNK